MSARYRPIEALEAAIQNDEVSICFKLNGGKAKLSEMISSYIEANSLTAVAFAKRSKSSPTWVSKFIHRQSDGISIKGIKQLAKSFETTTSALAAELFSVSVTAAAEPSVSTIEPVVLIVGQAQLVIEPTMSGTDPVVVELPGWRVALTMRDTLTRA